MAANLEQIKELRERTGAGMGDVKAALDESGGDIDKAVTIMRQKGQATPTKRAGKVAKAGLVDAYVHLGRVGVLVEVNCETDFVARTEDFKQFTHEVAMQVAAASPVYVGVSDIPAAEIKQEAALYASQAGDKPKATRDKMVEGKLGKYYAEVCLLKQPLITNDKISVEERLAEVVAKLGEKIVITRFARFELGGK